MSKYDYELVRRAATDWTCEHCGKTIPRGTRYLDQGWRNKWNEWIHVRKHLHCYPERELPMPVSLRDGTKEWLLGAVHDMEGRNVLLTHDWDMKGHHHYRRMVYDECGLPLYPKDIK